MAASPLPSWGPKRGRNCDVIPAFSGVPNAKRGDNIRSGCLTFAFSRGQHWAEWLRNTYVLGGPRKKGQYQKWLPHPCLLGGPKVGRITTQPLRSLGCLKRAQTHKRLHHPSLLGGVELGGIAP